MARPEGLEPPTLASEVWGWWVRHHPPLPADARFFRISAMPIFANIRLCSSALVSGLVSTDRVRPVPNRTGEGRTPRSVFIPIHCSSSLPRISAVPPPGEPSLFVVCRWCWRQHWRQAHLRSPWISCGRHVRASIIAVPCVGMDLDIRRTRWRAKALKPLGERQVGDAHHLAQLGAFDPIVRLVIEKLEI